MSDHLPALRRLSVGASAIDLLCWSVCSRAELMSYHMQTQYTHSTHTVHTHTHTHTHYLTFQQQR